MWRTGKRTLCNRKFTFPSQEVAIISMCDMAQSRVVGQNPCREVAPLSRVQPHSAGVPASALGVALPVCRQEDRQVAMEILIRVALWSLPSRPTSASTHCLSAMPSSGFRGPSSESSLQGKAETQRAGGRPSKSAPLVSGVGRMACQAAGLSPAGAEAPLKRDLLQRSFALCCGTRSLGSNATPCRPGTEATLLMSVRLAGKDLCP